MPNTMPRRTLCRLLLGSPENKQDGTPTLEKIYGDASSGLGGSNLHEFTARGDERKVPNAGTLINDGDPIALTTWRVCQSMSVEAWAEEGIFTH